MKRTVAVSTPGVSLSVQDSRLVVADADSPLARIPLEDIGILVLEGPGIRVTSGTLQALSENGAPVLSCDGHHLPCGLMLPVAANSLHAERIRFQAAATLPLQKNLWSAVVRAKILNQAIGLGSSSAARRLDELAKSIRSGDATNAEAQAARAYWPRVFGSTWKNATPFRRSREGPFPNPLLNYGYAVLRAATARALCGSGLHPGIGIHHRNRYSGFPLADDMMEPYRPWVDRAVRGIIAGGATGLDRPAKTALLGVLAEAATTRAGEGPVLVCLERTAASLAIAFEASARKEASAVEASRHLDLPTFTPDE